MPTDPQEARARLADVEAQLSNLQARERAARRAASFWPRVWLRAGCAALAAQLVGFAYLTWWELSWDVMEPVAYFMSLTYSFMAYVYFLSRGSVLDYKPFEQHWTDQQMRKKMAELGLDPDRHAALERQAATYRRYLAAQAQAAACGREL